MQKVVAEQEVYYEKDRETLAIHMAISDNFGQWHHYRHNDLQLADMGITAEAICCRNCTAAASCFGGMVFSRRISYHVQFNGKIKSS